MRQRGHRRSGARHALPLELADGPPAGWEGFCCNILQCLGVLIRIIGCLLLGILAALLAASLLNALISLFSEDD